MKGAILKITMKKKSKQPINKIKLTFIPLGSHGSTPTQKRYWKVTSDFVRIRDFYKYKRCIACGRFANHWSELQGGHYKAWASCRGYSKWDKDNIFGECGICNTGFNSNEVGANFKEGIISRHGQERMDYINSLSSYPTEKMEDYIIEDKIIEVLEEMKSLPEQPEYYYKYINQ